MAKGSNSNAIMDLLGQYKTEPVDSPYFFTLVLGRPKVGKTTFVGSLLDYLDSVKSPEKVAYIDMEGGRVVLPESDRLDVFTFPSLEDTLKMISLLGDRSKHPYGWLIFDSYTELNNRLLEELVALEARTHPGKRQEYTPQIQDYAKVKNTLLGITRMLIDLPLHKVCTGHIKELVIPGEGKMQGPDFTPKGMPNVMTGLFHEVVYLVTDETRTRYLLLQNEPGFLGLGCRVKNGTKFPDNLAPPTFDMFVKALRGEMANTTVGHPRFALDFDDTDQREKFSVEHNSDDEQQGDN